MGVRILLFIISDICQLLCGHDDVLSNRYRVFTQTLCLYGTCRDSFDVVCSPIVCLVLTKCFTETRMTVCAIVVLGFAFNLKFCFRNIGQLSVKSIAQPLNSILYLSVF